MLTRDDAEREILTTAMAKLIYEDQEYLENGVPHQKLLGKIVSAKENAGHSKKYLEGVIRREYENSGIVRMPNGNYSLGPRDGYADYARMDSSNNSSRCSSPGRGKPKASAKAALKKGLSSEPGIRVGERRKRAKKVFDPSENNLPKRKRGRPIGSLNKTTMKRQFQNKPLKTYTRKPKSTESVGSGDEDEEDDGTNDSASLVLSDVGNKVPGGVCSVCRQTRCKKDNSEKLVGCRDCSNKAHPPCLQGDGMLRLRPDNTWQCPHCKTCVVCIETMDAGILTVCRICSDAYHQLCHSPAIQENNKAWNMWECKNCQQAKHPSQNLDGGYIEDKTPSSDSGSKLSDNSQTSIGRQKLKTPPDSDEKEKPRWSSPSYSPVAKVKNHTSSNSDNENSIENRKPSKRFRPNPIPNNDDIDPSIPDATNWTPIDIYNYFMQYFPEHAHIFKEQAIDGVSLMVMQRNDVINYLGLDLGPALKIYRHIVKLQSRKDDIKMCWF